MCCICMYKPRIWNRLLGAVLLGVWSEIADQEKCLIKKTASNLAGMYEIVSITPGTTQFLADMNAYKRHLL